MQISTSEGIELSISANELRTKLEYDLLKTDTQIYTYDLSMLKDILTVESINIDSKRQSRISSKKLVSRVATGATIGGVVDAFNAGDSILDGLLVGAALGYLFSPSKQNPMARITLIFSDNASLAVTVDQDAMNFLIAVATENRTTDNFNETNNTSLQRRPLNSNEKFLCYRELHRMKIASIWFTVMLISILSGFFLSYSGNTPRDSSFHIYEIFVSQAKHIFLAMGLGVIISAVLSLIFHWVDKNPYNDASKEIK